MSRCTDHRPAGARTAVAAVIGVLALVSAQASAADAATAKVPTFRNCTAMHRVYPHGVGRVGAHDHVSGHSKPVTNFYRSTKIYNANKARDRDHDGIACEQH